MAENRVLVIGLNGANPALIEPLAREAGWMGEC